jgi:hypothetical protein
MNAGFRPDAAFAGAAERFFELMRTFAPPPGSAGAGGAAASFDPAALAGALSGQFEQWLRTTQSSGTWLGGTGRGGQAAPAMWPFAPLPLGVGAVANPEGQRGWELITQLAQLQAQLASHWHDIATGASQQFVARLGAHAAVGPPTLEGALKLYELWVDCAEQAYAASVHKDEFAQLQSQLANVSAALVVEQRRYAEGLARAFGLPTRNEIDSLEAELKELRRQLAARGQTPQTSPAAASPPKARTPGRASAAGATTGKKGRGDKRGRVARRSRSGRT